MKKKPRVYILVLLVLTLAVISGAMYINHMANRYKVLDRDVFNDFVSRVEEVSASGGFESREQLSSFVADWADEKSVKYKIDSHGNIIFDSPAIERKKRVSPTVIILDVNYLTAADNANLLASAASIAAADLNSGRRTIIFANNDLEDHEGIRYLNRKYIGDKSKVIYLDYGPKAYVSVNSYARSLSEVSIKAGKEDNKLDTAVRIHIGGADTSAVGPDISEHPDIIAELGILLNRLKSRSVEFRIADFEIGSYDNMYPDSMDVTVVMNSYSVSSYSKYLDQRIKKFLRPYTRDFPDLTYEYEVIEDEEDIPGKCYNAKTGDLLARVLYTTNSGIYKFTVNDPVPDSCKVGDICGINCMMGLEKSSSAITLKLLSQACDDTYLNRIVMDNRAAAELNDCKFSETDRTDAFINDRNSLLRTFRTTYSKVYDVSDNAELTIGHDDRFTPCSYLAEKNGKADIIHLRLSNKSVTKLTNTLLCYIKAKGNTFTL